jgi:hypothetical protein
MCIFGHALILPDWELDYEADRTSRRNGTSFWRIEVSIREGRSHVPPVVITALLGFMGNSAEHLNTSGTKAYGGEQSGFCAIPCFRAMPIYAR